MPDPVRIIPLGGLGEVGKNMTVFEHGGRMILLDAGLSFPRSEMLGIDLVLPDFALRGRARRHARRRSSSRTATRITSARCRTCCARSGTSAEVWGTRLTLGLVKSKLDEHGLLVHTELVEIDAGRRHRRRSARSTAEFVRVTHSVPDAVAVVLHTEHGAIVHTGDFKLDADPDRRPRRPTCDGCARSATPASRC